MAAVAGQRELVTVEQFTGPAGRDLALKEDTSRLLDTLDAAYQGVQGFHGVHGLQAIAGLEGFEELKGLTSAGPEALGRLAQRGIRVRALFPRTLLSVPRHARGLRELSDVGVTVRVAEDVVHDMLVFDGITVCLPGGSGDFSESMIRIRGAVLARSFATIYESYWQRATPLSRASARPHHADMSPQERAVVRLMTNGYSDDRIARKLGIATEAVQHVMTSLMQRLGAGSRFEVGYKLARELDPREL
jgi:DNA-binding NarL/FixJ family response regulator